MKNLLFHFKRLVVGLFLDSGFIEDFLKSLALSNGFNLNSSVTHCLNQVVCDGVVLIVIFAFLGHFLYPSEVFGE